MVKLSPHFRNDYLSCRLEGLKTAQKVEHNALEAVHSSLKLEFVDTIKDLQNLAIDWLEKAEKEISLASHPDTCAKHYMRALESLSACKNSIVKMRELRQALVR